MGRIKLIIISIALVLLVGCGSKEVKKAKEYMDAGMYERAVELLETEVDKNPRNAEAHFLLGRCLLRAGNEDDAEESFGRASLLNRSYAKKTSVEYHELGLEYLSKDDLRGAFYLFEKAVEKDAGIKAKVARLYFDKAVERSKEPKDVRNIIALFDKAIELDNRWEEKAARGCYNLAKDCIDKGLIDEALRYAEKSIHLDPKYIKHMGTMYMEAGLAYIEKGDYRKAFQVFGEATKKEPKLTRKIARLCFDKAMEETIKPEAVSNMLSLFTGAAELDKGLTKEIAEYCYKLAKVYMEKEFVDVAVQCAEKSIAINPKHISSVAEIFKDAGAYYYKNGQTNKGRQWIRKAVELRGDLENDETVFYINKIDTVPPPSVEELEAFVKSFPRSQWIDEVLYTLGNRYVLQNDKKKARKIFSTLANRTKDPEWKAKAEAALKMLDRASPNTSGFKIVVQPGILAWASKRVGGPCILKEKGLYRMYFAVQRGTREMTELPA